MANQRAPTKVVDVFESTLQKTNCWLKDLESVLRTEDRPRAYAALRAVLHTLRDCMPVDETAKFSAQMPLLLRGVFYDGWKPRRKPTRLTKGGFLNAIRDCLRTQEGLDPALAARGVFAMLEKHLSAGEIGHIRRVLPTEVRQFWAQSDRQAAMPAASVSIPREAPEWQPGWAARQSGERAGVGDLRYWPR